MRVYIYTNTYDGSYITFFTFGIMVLQLKSDNKAGTFKYSYQ